jgi:hypothetical protein
VVTTGGITGGTLTQATGGSTFYSLAGTANDFLSLGPTLGGAEGAATTGWLRVPAVATILKTRHASVDYTMLATTASGGLSFVIGDTGKNWYTYMYAYLVAIIYGASGGSFQVQNGTNTQLWLGAGASDQISFGATPSTTGWIRLTNTSPLMTVRVSATDYTIISGVSASTVTFGQGGSTGLNTAVNGFQLQINAYNGGNGVTIYTPTLQVWDGNAANMVWSVDPAKQTWRAVTAPTTTPAAGTWFMYIDSADRGLKTRSPSNVVTLIATLAA